MCFSLAIIGVIGVWVIARSRFGRSLIAVRDHEAAASSVGIDLARTKVLAFALSAMYAGIAGSLSVLIVFNASADKVEVFQNSPAARVALDSPLVERLRGIGSFEVQPKQAWTNVADFAARGLDAVNLGPGATLYAHTADEQVSIAELARTYDALRRFLAAA